jgi:hypothetical protein
MTANYIITDDKTGAIIDPTMTHFELQTEVLNINGLTITGRIKHFLSWPDVIAHIESVERIYKATITKRN